MDELDRISKIQSIVDTNNSVGSKRIMYKNDTKDLKAYAIPVEALIFNQYNNSKIKWLYCVPKYPCSLEELDFSELDKFDGFSNHCPQLMAPLSAAILGTEIIEIHITSDKTKKFIDNNVSFDYNELTEVIRLIRLSEKIKR